MIKSNFANMIKLMTLRWGKVIMVLAVVIQLGGYRNKEVSTPRLEHDIHACTGGRNHHN